jgi:hypothetical protein
MLKIDQFQIGQYAQPLHKHGHTQYCVPEKVTRYKMDPTKGQYVAVKEYHGRMDCGLMIHKYLGFLKDYQKTLGQVGSIYYTKQMSQHPIKMGHGVGNYTAHHMVTDKQFNPYPNLHQKRPNTWAQGTWAIGSPIPKYQEPYWATTHALEKMHSWIFEYLNWIDADPCYTIEDKIDAHLDLDHAIIKFDVNAQTNSIIDEQKEVDNSLFETVY